MLVHLLLELLGLENALKLSTLALATTVGSQLRSRRNWIIDAENIGPKKDTKPFEQRTEYEREYVNSK